MNNWYDIAFKIFEACKPLAERVEDEGVKLMLTDTDWLTLEGFQLVLQQSDQGELLALSVAAGLTRSQFDAMLDLYHFRKRSR